MLGLTVTNLKIVVGTNGGNFSATIPFVEGLNIIRAENSSGKSTCVNAIAYALGLEAILGPGRKRPFTKSLYEVIFDSKINNTPYFVSSSFVSLEIRNSDGLKATVVRDIRGNDSKVSVTFDQEAKDFFLGSSGNVGSAKSERGFHNWLARFLKWDLPGVVSFEGKETKLYLECIFPLFFVEQKRGWSEIQANTPTTYGIRNVKRSATEFCLGIDSFEHEKRVAKLRREIELAEAQWELLRSSIASLSELNELQVDALPDLGHKDAVYSIEFSFLENEVYLSIGERKRSLQREIKALENAVADSEPSHEQLDNQLAVLRRLQRKAEKNSQLLEQTIISISEVDSKLKTLKRDYSQYQQLKRLKTVGSDISLDLETKQCPICESDLYDTLGNRTVKREPMSLEENIEFLKNQLEFFGSIKEKSFSDLERLSVEQRVLRSRMRAQKERVSYLKEDISDIHGATKALLREKIQTEMAFKDVQNLEQKKDELNEDAQRILTNWNTASAAIKVARSKSTVAGRESVIGQLESQVRGNLVAFDFNQSSVDSVSISRYTLRPEQEGYDIVAETSASDYIRVIWSYTLALLELAGSSQTAKHGGFVVFDEPRQHEASKVSFASLIDKAAEARDYGGQVIFATSLDSTELEASCEGKAVNLMRFDDYILALEKE